jgi:LacI family transcriptional regulator
MEKNIRDIAKEAGVSVATVSKVINGYPYVSDKTREKVQRIVRESQFVPNSAARELVRKRSMTLGLFLTTGLKHPFFHNLFVGMENALKETGYELIYLVQVSWNKDYSFVQHCRSRNVEGVILFGFQRNDLNLDELIQSEIPTVFIDLDLTGRRAGYITSDNFESILTAVDYMYQLNHRRIAFIAGMLEAYTGRTRFEAYQQAIINCGLPYNSEYTAIGDFSKESGYEAMKKFLALDHPPTAVICSSDTAAVGAIEAIQEAGLHVPDDISVMGFDDIELATYVRPALTTIRQDAIQMGKHAIETLVDLIQNTDYPAPSIKIPTELIIRDTCAPCAEPAE